MRRESWWRRGMAFAWVLAAAALLAVLWFSTVRGVDAGTRDVEERRLEDRQELAGSTATSLDAWFEAGRRTVGDIAAALSTAPAGARRRVLEEHTGPGTAFARSALMVTPGMTVRAGTGAYSALADARVSPCSQADPSGSVVTDAGFADLVETALTASGPTLSPVIPAPGNCQPAVAVAAPVGNDVVVAFGDLDDARIRLGVAAGAGEDTRAVLVDPNGVGVRTDGTASPVAAYLADFAARPGGAGPQRLDAGDTQVVAARAPLAGDWVVVVAQDAAGFDLPTSSRPAVIVAGVLSVVFVAVFAVLVFFDARRRRAQRRADVAKQAFFGIVSHELRTPLTVLKGTTDTLAARWESVDDAARRQLVESMGPQVHRLGQVVERVLTASHLAAGTHPTLTPAPVEVEPLIRGVMAEFTDAFPLHEFQAASDGADDGEVRAVADPDALATALRQLLDNATRYSPKGGTVRVTWQRRRRSVEIAVEDEGVGLPSDVEPLFEPFTQAEDVLRRVQAEGGVGVGLFIVRTLVEEMNGSVRAESPATGARFVISLKGAAPA